MPSKNKKELQSFHGDKAVKAKYVKRVLMHQNADRLVRGTGWDGQKGCAVGCTLENYNHDRYPIELGLPVWLARVEDSLFESMSEDKSNTWPHEFLKSIPVGVTEKQFDQVKADFLVIVFKSCLESFDHKKFPDVKKVVDGCIELWQSADIGTPGWAARAAEWAARAAEWAARAAEWAAGAYAAKMDYFADQLLILLKKSNK